VLKGGRKKKYRKINYEREKRGKMLLTSKNLLPSSISFASQIKKQLPEIKRCNMDVIEEEGGKRWGKGFESWKYKVLC
jgi:hypothetical protein